MCENILKDCVQNYVLQSTSDLVEIELRSNQNAGRDQKYFSRKISRYKGDCFIYILVLFLCPRQFEFNLM